MATLNTINAESQAILADGFMTFATNQVRTGCGCEIVHTAGSNTIELRGAGVYLVTVNADVAPTGAGLITMQLVRNTLAVSGAEASVTGVAGETENLSFTTLVKVLRSCPVIDNQANLQVQLTAPATVTNVSATIVKVA